MEFGFETIYVTEIPRFLRFR